MKKLLKSNIGRLRLIAVMEGTSLLILLFVATPLKYIASYPILSHYMGAIHGGLFLLFVFNTLAVGIEQNWKFRTTTWKIMIACLIPFGTFYVDRKILRKL